MTQAFYGNPWAVKPWARFYGSGGMYVPMPQATRANGYAWLAPSGYQFSGLGGITEASWWTAPATAALPWAPRWAFGLAFAYFGRFLYKAFIQKDGAGHGHFHHNKRQKNPFVLYKRPEHKRLGEASTLEGARSLASGPGSYLVADEKWHRQTLVDEFEKNGRKKNGLGTYADARHHIMSILRADGWTVKDGLKIPHATSPDGQIRLWFKTQSIYYTLGSYHIFGDARSTHVADIRTLSPSAAVADALRIPLAHQKELRGNRRKNRSHRDLYSPVQLVARAHRAGVAAKAAGRGHDVWSAWANMGSDLGKTPQAFHAAYDAGYFGRAMNGRTR